MRAFLRTRAFLVILAALLVLLALESLFTHDTVAGVLLLAAGATCVWRVVRWREPPE
jgi:uncharacterized protein involved in response to NO